jgi:putative hydrolase of the HAD superfamily
MSPVIGFDADDTLWHCENHFAHAQEQFMQLLAPYRPKNIALEQLYETEKHNMRLYGYGVKGFVLSMIETAVDVTDGRMHGHDIKRIIELGRDILDQKLELIDGARPVLETLANSHRLLLITKGDLLDQEAKIARSGLGGLFTGIEIVSEKDAGAYSRLLAEHGVPPEQFVMVGNSLRSDILPVLSLGGRGIHIPYRITAPHEQVSDEDLDGLALLRADDIRDVPHLIRRLEA